MSNMQSGSPVTAHKLIHATEEDTIAKYLDILKLDDKALKKVNSLRLSAENLEIVVKAN